VSRLELLESISELYDLLVFGKKKRDFIETERSVQTSFSPKENTYSQHPSEEEDWDKIRSEVISCIKCRLFRTRRKAVFGDGSNQTMLMVVGEGPGADEDLQGSPFVGKAGQLLTKMLQAVQIKREKIFITNIVKCRPPENRDPQPDEISVCSNYLKRQIALIRPKVILTLGRIAASFFLETKEGITKLRGKSYEKNGIIIVPIFHPSALLRNEALKYPAWEDLKMLKEILEKLGFYQNDSIEK